MQLFDSHAHLDDRAFDADRDALIASLPAAGIALVMNPGCSRASSRAAAARAARYPFVYAAAGSHPDAADEVGPETLDAYRALIAANPKIRAIGEIGLDYHYEDIPRTTQQAAFRAQLALAAECGLPAIVHDRDAHGDALAIIGEFPAVTGVFHCFSGSPEMARELVRRGWYVGFTGVLTFKNARRALEAAAAVPKDRILLETDCPYMSPEPHRGRRNDPGNLIYMAQKLAALWQTTPDQTAAATTQNAKRLYKID